MSVSVEHLDAAQSTEPDIFRLAVVGAGQGLDRQGLDRQGLDRQGLNCKTFAGSDRVTKFPKRPDRTILSESIPLFYIGQNKHGFWVAREAVGRSGGLFLRQSSALRFAKHRSEPSGCATMFLTAPVDLDVENQGGRFVALLTAAVDFTAHHAPAVVDFVAMAVAEWRKLVAEISRALAGERRNRAAIERELFNGQYRLLSKNDDDLPLP